MVVAQEYVSCARDIFLLRKIELLKTKWMGSNLVEFHNQFCNFASNKTGPAKTNDENFPPKTEPLKKIN